MIYKQNLHNHTSFCDGKNTPREMIEIAKKKGFNSIGFSGHSYTPYSPHRFSMDAERENLYFDEITSLKKEYGEEFVIFCGIEFDMYSPIDISRYDYSLGSVHYLKINDEYVGIDVSAENLKKVIDSKFNGNVLLCAQKYYECLSNITKYADIDIIAHFDLITKCFEQEDIFNVNSKEYLSCAIDCARSLVGKVPYFEVNTGVVARGYRSKPYPLANIMCELNRLGFGAVITSDCHNAEYIDFYFDDAKELLKQCGFKYQYILTKEGFVPDRL